MLWVLLRILLVALGKPEEAKFYVHLAKLSIYVQLTQIYMHWFRIQSIGSTDAKFSFY